MGSGNNRPVERIKHKRKDGKPGVGTNRDGGTYEAAQVEVFTVWADGDKRSLSLAPGITVCYNGKPLPDGWFNIYPADSKGAKGGSSRKDADEDDDF